MDSIDNKYNPQLCKMLLAISDLFFFNVALWLSLGCVYLIFNEVQRFIPQEQLDSRFISHFILSIVCVGWFWIRLRHYTYRKPFWYELKEIIRTIVIFAVFDLALIAFTKWQFSRYVWVFCWSFALILVPLFRVLTKHLLNKLGIWKKTTVILGCGENAIGAYNALQSEEMMGFNVVAFFDTDAASSEICSLPVIQDVEKIWSLNRTGDIHYILAYEYTEPDKTQLWLRELSKHHCRSVTVVPSFRGLPLYNTDMSFIFSHEVMLLRIQNNLAKRTSRFLKRTFDIVCSSLILLVASPLMIYLWYKVTRDGGPAIYGHQRVGRNGKLFPCYKFRSMVMNSQEVLKELLDSDPEARAEWEKDFKLKNDPRITAVGRFIRKTSLDELPQLFNVLKGEMSLVGPRPIISDELERYCDDVDYYLMAKPGMTGLWQVSGRNDVDYDTRVYFDAWYVKNWTLWNDIAILFKTVKVVLHRDGAY
ncbi:undecaprenyl-phosphate galactose phosphotransferase [Enterobacter roggenkampii]|jgi:undecaprenyl-phosphate galactose phosphotransferase|uniref:undecaprenyl-phosphate galactose phosphotransferase n=1 Tax=Enterobacter roggenkampii TaxID=1812935 RepID=UPI0005EE2132|nr:undecaprenyl-phosphate galactose phosphotransferase WbaP [Enterobacter roggenkampii]ELN9581100.1 undecaprenyl-phosphate galactose phosphotransferase WbaP [Enterobacter roggenkampii]KJM45167.1 UDP-phosphate galactose phosphotransferase [Enterobacter roggenkampii]KTI34361.1 UDP-phosphate galactose phosphotransferase [Enterobacter roggenkampii]MBO4170847.1 undecaprenyl-phosphate galactose phosphotransferase WbaP [Enterobacter roggenkampii]MCK6717409.1 undecaprenyl-phosphate galactose phosphotr